MEREPLLRKATDNLDRTAWASQAWWLGAGTHTVRFQYRKDGATTAGLDAGFIDCLALQ